MQPCLQGFGEFRTRTWRHWAQKFVDAGVPVKSCVFHWLLLTHDSADLEKIAMARLVPFCRWSERVCSERAQRSQCAAYVQS